MLLPLLIYYYYYSLSLFLIIVTIISIIIPSIHLLFFLTRQADGSFTEGPTFVPISAGPSPDIACNNDEHTNTNTISILIINIIINDNK